jgi:hypothetical protein
MTLYFSLPSVDASIFYQFQLNSTATAQTRSILRRSDEFGTGQIEVAFTRPFLGKAEATP